MYVYVFICIVLHEETSNISGVSPHWDDVTVTCYLVVLQAGVRSETAEATVAAVLSAVERDSCSYGSSSCLTGSRARQQQKQLLSDQQ